MKLFLSKLSFNRKNSLKNMDSILNPRQKNNRKYSTINSPRSIDITWPVVFDINNKREFIERVKFYINKYKSENEVKTVLIDYFFKPNGEMKAPTDWNSTEDSHISTYFVNLENLDSSLEEWGEIINRDIKGWSTNWVHVIITFKPGYKDKNQKELVPKGTKKIKSWHLNKMYLFYNKFVTFLQNQENRQIHNINNYSNLKVKPTKFEYNTGKNYLLSYKSSLYNIKGCSLIENKLNFSKVYYSTQIKTKNTNNEVDKSSIKYSKHENENTLFSSDVFKGNHIFKYIYNNLINIIKTNPINNHTQLKIENYLFNQYKDIIIQKDNTTVSDIDFSLLNKNFKEYCFTMTKDIEGYLDLLRDKLNSDKSLDKNIEDMKTIEVYNYYIKNIINKLDNEEIVSYILYVIFLVVTYNDMVLLEEDSVKLNEKTKIGVTAVSINLGKVITNAYISKLFKEYNKDTSSIEDFKTFKLKCLTENEISAYGSSEFFLRLSGYIIEIMVVCDIIQIKIHTSYNNSLAVLKLTDKLEKLLEYKNPIAILPMNLPMIVPPKEHSKDELGGFLLNNLEYDEDLITPKIAYDIPSKIEECNIIYDTINNMAKTPFKVNKDLLDYLLKNNHIHNLLISSKYQHEYSNIKRNKRQEKEYQSFLSKKTLEKYILLIASIYSNVPEIYFPLKLDHRGRIYPNIAYFHYQSNELCKALIQFAIPDIIKRNNHQAIEYLKAYGATCYGNGLNRKSYTKRLEWVKENWDNIIKFENGYLVSRADDKFLFLAFCIEMRRFNNFIDNEFVDEFKTYLPIQLDGTCNGFQHLTLLSNETELFDKLNLSESKKDKDPIDFYSHVLDILNIYLEREKRKEDVSEKTKQSIKRLLALGLNRSILKPVIMNDPYNATNRTLTGYVRDLLIYSHTDEKELLIDNEGKQIYDSKTNKPKYISISWYKLNKESNCCVNYEDLEYLVYSIDQIIYVKYPKIKILKEYFYKIGLIFNKLNLPIIWRLPSGLKVSQKYLKRKSLKINPFTYLSNSLSLTITDNLHIDKSKQLSAFMPNLVHSLDAATLTLLYNSLTKSVNPCKNQYINFYSVHDCYAVTATYVDILIEMLRSVYVELYSGEGYIEKFDEDIINTIILSQGEDISRYSPEDRTIYIGKRKKIVLPDLSRFLNVPNKDRVYKSLSKSIFLIK